MVQVADKPILEHNLEWLKRFGITEVIINLHYLPQMVMDYFGNGSRWGIEISYSMENEILGTAGGVRKAKWFFEDKPFDTGRGKPFLVWYGDNLSTCDLNRMMAFHGTKGGLGTIALFEREDVTQSGIVELGENNRIIRFLEKPSRNQIFSHWVNAGIFILEPEVLDYIPMVAPVDFGRDVFPALIYNNQQLYGYRMSVGEGLWWIDTVEDLQKTRSEINRRRSI